MQTYKEWIIQRYLGKDSPRGDLAYDIKYDKTFPRGCASREQILEYLNSRNACDGAIKAFESTWSNYCKTTGFQGL